MEYLKNQWESTSVRNRYIFTIGFGIAIVIGVLSFTGILDLSGGI
jgi:hypothetical protein